MEVTSGLQATFPARRNLACNPEELGVWSSQKYLPETIFFRNLHKKDLASCKLSAERAKERKEQKLIEKIREMGFACGAAAFFSGSGNSININEKLALLRISRQSFYLVLVWCGIRLQIARDTVMASLWPRYGTKHNCKKFHWTIMTFSGLIRPAIIHNTFLMLTNIYIFYNVFLVQISKKNRQNVCAWVCFSDKFWSSTLSFLTKFYII